MTTQITPLLLGLDLGTTNAKAAIYTVDGVLVSECAVPYPTFHPQPAWAEQRPADWVDALRRACRQVMSELGVRANEVIGLALSAQGPGVILVDAAGSLLLDRSPIWQDTRCLPQGEWLIEQVGAGWTGLGIPQNSFPPKLLWTIEHQAEAAQRARYALGIKEYLVYWLTGEFVSEPSSGPGGDRWWEPVFTACGWSLDRLAAVRPSTAIVGQVRTALLAALGLPRALPVVIGLNDGASATLSMGAIRPYEVVITLATSGVLRIVLPQPLVAEVRLAHNLFFWPYLPGSWIAGGHLKAGASSLQWLSGVLIDSPESANDKTGDKTSDKTIDSLLREAATAPIASNGIVFLPYLLGRGSPHADAQATGAFLGLSLTHRRSEMTRALLEGIAFAFRDVFVDFQQMGYTPSYSRISGGGARSVFWRQILADVLGYPLLHFAADSTLGAAMMAAVGMGVYTNFEAAVQAMVRTQGVTEPIPRNQARYAEGYALYQQWRERLYPIRGKEIGRLGD